MKIMSWRPGQDYTEKSKPSLTKQTKKINKQISKQRNKINQSKTQRIKRWFKIKYSVGGMNSNSFQF